MPKKLLKTELHLRTEQRLTLFGRLKMAEWIEMPEREFAGVLKKLEEDPLFQKLFRGLSGLPGVLRRQRWPLGRFSNAFYEMNEQTPAASGSAEVEKLLGRKAALLPKIKRMGREAFEKYFVYAEEPLSLKEIAHRTGLSLNEAKALHDLLLDIGVVSEFFRPQADPGIAYTCLAQVTVEDGKPEFQFYTPSWARGAYHVRYDLLERWKREGRLSGKERQRLRFLLKKIEIVNLRQNTIYRILESLAALQTEYLRTHREDLMRPISLRMLAHRLDLAASTVSRALAGRSLRLPWGKEAPLIKLVPGQRKVLREILSRWLERPDPKESDARLAERLMREYRIRVSRRTINTVRNEILKNQPT